MMAGMSAAQFKGWQTYDRVFGLGDMLELIGPLLAMIAQATGRAKARPEDFVPYFAAGRPEQTQEEMLAMFVGSAVRHNAGVAGG